MIDYEYMILQQQESESDECRTCPNKGSNCRNQCMEIHEGPRLEEVYPGLFQNRRATR